MQVRVWQREPDIVPGATYYASVALLADLSPPENDRFNVVAEVAWFSEAHAIISRTDFVKLTIDDEGFTRWSDIMTAPDGASYAQFRILVSGMDGSLYVDDARFRLVD